MFEFLTTEYGLDASFLMAPVGAGLINRTWKISSGPEAYILQQVNTDVFQQPLHVAENINAIGEHLHTHHPAYLFLQPLRTRSGAAYYINPQGGFFRLWPFLQAHSYTVVSTPQLAFEAAGAFGKFTRLLATFPARRLQPTIPHFHDLALRWQQFTNALQHAQPHRKQSAATAIAQAQSKRSLVHQLNELIASGQFPVRVMHHDTKISNVLFTAEGKSLCVIDLDTVMPGYFFSDVGDMLRTYVAPVSEEEQDFSKIVLRPDVFSALASGYLSQMQPVLTEAEKQHFVFAGKVMIYMQALRFLTDYLQNDHYYGSRYEGHNLVRAGNQLCLLQQFEEAEETYNRELQTIFQLAQ